MKKIPEFLFFRICRNCVSYFFKFAVFFSFFSTADVV